MSLPLHPSDLHGLSQLSIDGVRGVTDLVEDLHHAILRVPGIRAVSPQARTGGIPGVVYRSIHGVTGLVGGGLDLAFARIVPRFEPAQASPGRDHLLAVINGVLGDHLAATGNPLAIRSTFRRAGRPVAIDAEGLAVAFPTAQSRLLVTAHGLCMHDGHWYTDDDDGQAGQRTGLPEELADALSCSTIDYYYNTGRHIADSGREFAEMLETLVAHWPVEIGDLTILGHSMGGLLARSAIHYGLEAGHGWPQRVGKLVFLGTPHHGSPVERAGHGIDRVLGISRYSAPFTRLGKIRSAGITDLRHGNIVAPHGDNPDRFAHAHDTRVPTRLPEHIECFAVAATLDAAPDSARSRRIGDGLVPVPSALGQHDNRELHLDVKPNNQFVATETGHMQLLRCPRVARKVHAWLA
ncbi:MAG: alpha/beta hydrolase [Wenzhouxiangellaceae bacterium]